MSGGEIVYLAGCVLCLALAALNVVQITRLFLWRVGVVTTEFGHWLFFPALALSLSGVRGPWPVQAGAVAAGVAALVLIRPFFQALALARRLPVRMEQAFEPLPVTEKARLPAPFSLWTLVLGRRTPPFRPEEFVYAEREGVPLRLLFRRAAAAGPVPCVVHVHGGGWNSGGPEEGAEFNAFLAGRGYAVASIQYRLAPAARWPAPRDDLFEALRWLKAHAAELGIDPERFVLLGRSAGGQIAQVAAYTAADPAIRGCIAFYAPADMFFSMKYATPGDILDSYHLLVHYLGGTPDEARAAYADASGLLRVEGGAPPTLLLHGRHDPLVWFLQSERLARRLRDAGVPHAFVEPHWATHAFDYDRRTPGGQIAAYAVAYFLAAAANRVTTRAVTVRTPSSPPTVSRSGP